jgi:hypothetical protein
MNLPTFAKTWLIAPALILVEGWAMPPVASVGAIAAVCYLVLGVAVGRRLAAGMGLPKGAWVVNTVIVAVTALASSLVALASLIVLHLAAPARPAPNMAVAVLLTLVFAALFTGLAVFMADILLKPAPEKPEEEGA